MKLTKFSLVIQTTAFIALFAVWQPLLGAQEGNANSTSTVQLSSSTTVASLRSRNEDALIAYRNRDFQSAISITLKEIQQSPSNLDSYAVLGWSLNALKRYDEAIRYTQQGRAYGSNDQRLIGIMAEAHFALGNDVNAIAFFQTYIAIIGRIPGYDTRYIRDAYRDLAEVFIRNGELHHADIALSSSIAWNRGSSALDPVRLSRLWSRLGYVRELLKDLVQARTAWEQARRLDPAMTEAQQALVRLQGSTNP